jgi:hypothetical protein
VDADDFPRRVEAPRLVHKSTIADIGSKRGVTEAPETFLANMGLNRTHVVADQFLGSGFTDSLNIVSASWRYNQRKMGPLEGQIRQAIDNLNRSPFALEYFELTVELDWQDFDGPHMHAALMKAAPDPVLAKYQAMTAADVQAELARFLADLKSGGVTKTFKRIMDARYTATFHYAKDGTPRTPMTVPFPALGPDLWAGLDRSQPGE